MTTKEKEIVGIVDDDLQKLFAVNPIALEQVKRIIGERVIGEQDNKIKELEEELVNVKVELLEYDMQGSA